MKVTRPSVVKREKYLLCGTARLAHPSSRRGSPKRIRAALIRLVLNSSQRTRPSRATPSAANVSFFALTLASFEIYRLLWPVYSVRCLSRRKYLSPHFNLGPAPLAATTPIPRIHPGRGAKESNFQFTAVTFAPRAARTRRSSRKWGHKNVREYTEVVRFAAQPYSNADTGNDHDDRHASFARALAARTLTNIRRPGPVQIVRNAR